MSASEYVVPIVFSEEPPTFLVTQDPADAELARRAFATQWAYVHGQADELDLLGFLGRQIDGRLIEINPNWLFYWALTGEFDLAEVYREMFG
jgi:hypothetical protein